MRNLYNYNAHTYILFYIIILYELSAKTYMAFKDDKVTVLYCILVCTYSESGYKFDMQQHSKHIGPFRFIQVYKIWITCLEFLNVGLS